MKPIQLIINADGSYLAKENTFIANINQNYNTIQVIAPFSITDLVAVNFGLRSSEMLDLTQYLVPVRNNVTYLKGADVIPSDKPYYQTVKDWNVWEAPISSQALRAISKYHAGKVDVSVTFREYLTEYPASALTDKGTFGLSVSTTKGDLPITATVGDFYKCNRIFYLSAVANLEFNFGDLAIYTEDGWIKSRQYALRIGSPSTEIGIQSSILSHTLEDSSVDVSTINTILSRLAELENTTENYILLNKLFTPQSLVDGMLFYDKSVTPGKLTFIDGETEIRLGNEINDIFGLRNELNQLQGNINAEENARQQADITLQNNINLKADKATTYTKTETNNLLDDKVDKATTILGLDLSDNILLGEFKTALGEAITGVSGLMSAQDKARLDALHNLLEEDTSNNVVDSINEILDIFNNYPEGADLITALAGKVDKIAGYGLSENDYSDIEKNKVALSETHRQATGNPHGTTFNQLNDKPTTLEGYGITDAYTKAYIDSLKDLNGWESELITLTPLTNGQSVTKETLQEFDNIKLFARNTTTNEIDTDSFDTALGLVDGYNYQMFDNADITFTIGSPNCTFLTSAGYELSIIGQKYTQLSADKVSYGDDSNVEEALDSLLVPTYITATHEALQTEITATDAFEINDETGDVVKITGNEPTNIVDNGDFSDGIGTWTNYYNASLSIEDNALKVIKSAAANISTFRQPKVLNITTEDLFYFSIDIKTPHSFVYMRLYAYPDGTFIASPNYNVTPTDFTTFSHIGSFPSDTTTTTFGISVYINSEINTSYLIKNIRVYNITEMKLKGIKDDNGVPFANLTNEEIKSQLDIWVQNGFPTVVEKLVSKSDNLFNAEFKTLSSLDSEDLISNKDLLLDSNSDGVPDGFTVANAANYSLNNGVFTFTASQRFGNLATQQAFSPDNTYYFYADFKVDKPDAAYFAVSKPAYKQAIHSGSNEFEFMSLVGTYTVNTVCRISDLRDGTAGYEFTPISIRQMGAINITDLISRGILPSGLSNNEYKEMIDRAMFANVPLRETDYIAVESSKAYKLIKVSTNEVTHKVIEYTTDNQVVKVTPVVYTTNKFIFTTHALTSKIKLVSDMLERPTNLVPNSDFLINTDGNPTIPDFFTSSNTIVNSYDSGKFNYTATGKFGGIYTVQNNSNKYLGQTLYVFAVVKANHPEVRLTYGQGPTVKHPSDDKYHLLSMVNMITTPNRQLQVADYRESSWTAVEVDAMGAYNITDFQKAGVVDDNGTLFSRLTNEEIKDQMDIWIKVGFPDHVIAALYPNGVDSAIALKYNDADDIFRPQQIDVLPLNLTLRSGEYWQDGYVVKQNGNAEYHPLQTKFSAWNYGQLEAVYTSGVPADFDIRYAQNTASQVKTTQEFLVEAREQLDYVTEGYDNLVEKLGDAIFENNYDSYAGITSDTYEYYTLEGIKEGNTLAIEGAGQSIENLLGKGGTIIPTSTTRGITVTYDSDTGVFTANGTATAGNPFNITLATGMDFGLPVGTPMQLMRYYDADDGGTVDLNGSYIGYVLVGTSASNRINENSEALYDPYINGSGNLKPNHATDKQYLVLQCWAPGITFNNFKFKIGIYEGLQLRPFVLPSGEPAKSNVTVYNRTANMLNMPTALNIEDSGITITYDPLVQEFLLSGTATATKDISLNATFNALSGDRFSIKRLYQSGDVTADGGTLPRIKLVNSTNTTIVYNDIYKMTASEGQIPTPDVSFNTGTAPADDTLTLKLGITSGQVFDNYRFRLMIHDKSTDIGYVAHRREPLGNMSVGANERAVVEFKAIPYGILEFVADSGSLNLLFADSITDLDKTYLEYNAGIISPNHKISELTARAELIDNPFRNKVIAVWGDSRESNNPTSDPTGVGDQKDTSWPALLAKKLNATVLNYGLSGGAWAENTVQQDAASAIVNRVLTEDVSASADVIIISSMNDFKLASSLGSPLPDNKDKTTFYGAMRLTYERLAAKYPGKKIVLVLPQKRYDETVNYGGGSYYHYLKAQVEVAKEYGIPIVDLYHNFPNAKPAFYATNMLNDTHFSAVGNDLVAELVARELIGNGNKGDMDVIPPIPTTDGTYTLKVTITGGIPVFSWVA